ncbi:MAG: queuosine precursor transporter [Sulfolobales archaeon]
MWVFLFWGVGLTVSTLVSSWLVRRYRDSLGYPTLLTFYVAYILASNILASRISEFYILIPIIVSGGTITYPFVAQLVDMINEIYGRRMTYVAVFLAFVANVMVSMFILMLSTVPAAPWLAGLSDVWNYFMLQTPRIVLASYSAFLAAELLDATVFAEIKKRVYRFELSVGSMVKFAMLRSLGTDVVNMFVDSLVFFPLAFAFLLPWEDVWGMVWYGTYAKVLLATLDTPWFIAFRLLTKDVRRVID